MHGSAVSRVKLSACLRDEHAIERIGMMRREGDGLEQVDEVDRQ